MNKNPEAKPYIGVTGISNIEEAKIVAEIFDNEINSETHQGMMGYLIANTTIKWISPVHSKYPSLESLRSMLEGSKSKVFNTFHYKTPFRDSLSKELTQLFLDTGLYQDDLCRAVQLNIHWPPVDEIRKAKDKMDNLQVILQLGPRALLDETRVDTAYNLEQYRHLVDYVILDPSGGIGRPFQASFIAPFYRVVKHTLPEATIILGGGFSEENVADRLSILSAVLKTKEFGIDAEGCLRHRSSDDPHAGELSIAKTEGYISSAAKFFSS